MFGLGIVLFFERWTRRGSRRQVIGLPSRLLCMDFWSPDVTSVCVDSMTVRLSGRSERLPVCTSISYVSVSLRGNFA